MTTLCTDFEQNRLTFISKSAPVSQAEALKCLPTFQDVQYIDVLFKTMLSLLYATRGSHCG